jgi:ATP-dependent DNA helicase RecQ
MYELHTALNKYFGHSDFRYGQNEIISAILNGEQVIAVLPTGAGKSLCYQLPALISENFSIVISPLIALMKDQVDNFNNKNELAAFINSTMDYIETEDVLQKISYGKIKLLYVAPERLVSKNFADRILSLNPKFLFVDEAHCISEWGHNFRPSYAKINDFIKYCSIKNISAFTATATPEVVKDIEAQLKLKNPKIFVKGFERENLHLFVHLNVNKKRKCQELLSVIDGSAIIYTSSRKKTKEVSEFLTMRGFSCGYYHAGLNAIERRKVQEDFINDEIRVICATNAFGMGIDKKDIRLIIHFNMPGSIENYYQEIGRAGRDNKDSYIHLLYADNDINIQNYFISNSHPTKELIQNIYNAINDFNQIEMASQPEQELIIDTEYISNYTGMPVSRGLLHSSLKFLEAAGYLKPISELEKKDTIQILMSKNRLEEFVKRTSNAEIKNSLLILLREFGSVLFTKHKQVSIVKLSKLLGISEDTLFESLIILDNLGVISFRPSIGKETIFLTAQRVEKEQLVLNYNKINENYLNSKQKLDKMIDYIFTNDCRFKFILGYFGENIDNYKCGKCDNCTTSDKISDKTSDYLSEMILKTLAEADIALPEKSIINILKGDREKDSFNDFESFGAAVNYNKSELKVILQHLISKKFITQVEGYNRYLEITNLGLTKVEYIFAPVQKANNYEYELELYHILRSIRKKTSERFMQTQYLLCPNDVLRSVAKYKPLTKAALLNIPSFNNRMFNKIGEDFLEAIKSYTEKNKEAKRKGEVPSSIKETYKLLLKNYSLKEIAQLRKLTEPVVSMQIETILEYYPQCKIDFLFDSDTYVKIVDEVKKGYSSLKELKKRLPNEITYAQIRIVVAKNKVIPSL